MACVTASDDYTADILVEGEHIRAIGFDAAVFYQERHEASPRCIAPAPAMGRALVTGRETRRKLYEGASVASISGKRQQVLGRRLEAIVDAAVVRCGANGPSLLGVEQQPCV